MSVCAADVHLPSLVLDVAPVSLLLSDFVTIKGQWLRGDRGYLVANGLRNDERFPSGLGNEKRLKCQS
jgi:hypothetical protein